MKMTVKFPFVFITLFCLILFTSKNSFSQNIKTGVGEKVPKGAEVIFDGSRKMLDKKWTYWEGPRIAAELPIKWQIEKDPVDKGTVVNCNDPAAKGGLYGSADIVTKKKYRDFRLHVEFLITQPGGNSGVYLQNRYEIQILDGDSTKHGLGAVINETDSPYFAYNGVSKWNAYDINRLCENMIFDLLFEPIVSIC